MKKMLYIDNSVDCKYTPYDDWKKFIKMPYDIVYANKGEIPNNLKGYTHMLISGSVMYVKERRVGIIKTEQLICEAYDKNINTLGVCFGHQLIAKELYGLDKIHTREVPEIGWRKINVVEDDPIFGKKGEFVYGYVYHYQEVIDIDAKIIMSSDNCNIYTFRVKGKNMWGTQAHFEISEDRGKQIIKETLTSEKIQEYGVYKHKVKDSQFIFKMMKRFEALD